MPRLHALVPCAGTGSRAGTAGPKQYQHVAGQPLVLHTLQALLAVPRLATVLVAVAPGDTTLHALPGLARLQATERLVLRECGGATRADTVLAGLQALRALGAAGSDWVLVHDAARCLITPALVDTLIDACLGHAVGGLLAQPLADTLKRAEGSAEAQPPSVAATVPRAGLWLAQTPQMFRLGPLSEALVAAQAQGQTLTDEASALESVGQAPRLVPGSAHNIKVTWPEDFALAEALLALRRTAT
jgi:2-C-methyl-D-erythritol 4-phosphate cytidylyltransferase